LVKKTEKNLYYLYLRNSLAPLTVSVEPVSSEISDLRNFWLHAMCACTEWYSTYQIRWENWWL